MRSAPRIGTFAAVAAVSILASLAACGDEPVTRDPAREAGASALPDLEPTPPPLIPAEKRLDAASTPVAFDAQRGGVWTANGDAGSISYVDVDARRVIRELMVGGDVRSVALSPDFKWVGAVDRADGLVTLIDATTGTIAAVLKVGGHPRAAVWDSADPRWLYVSVEDEGAVFVIDRTRGVVDGRIDVGRLPSGLGVSRKRAELYVTHQIDARVSIVDLTRRAGVGEVSVADEPDGSDNKVPHGKPFAFESFAWVADGDRAWLPHELLAPTQPIRFDETLFPAVSVVDLNHRAEVTTDPTTGTIDGRKNLFDAINVLGADGQAVVVSQPCGAALHRGGLVGWVLACASEDLLVFDAASGTATDVLRDLPGDHPAGLTLDDTGARLFVVSDQSHTLLTLDTGAGSPVARTRLFGDPIPLTGHDPLDAQARLGATLFLRANSLKGALATTANDWMACGGCHLDGFTSTNAFFFESLHPSDPSTNGQIGHVGLRDVFGSARGTKDRSLAPHDIVVALLDQGGLDGDRTGAHPANLVDPNAPSDEATRMATALARVVARDLPAGPSWLTNRGAKPRPEYDGAWCGTCHQAEYAAWSKSVHARAGDDPMMLYCAGVETELRGPNITALCAGCHDPVTARLGDLSLSSKRGVTCLGCHEVNRTLGAGGNADLEASGQDWTRDHKAMGSQSLVLLRDPAFCGGCHQQFVPGSGLSPAFATLSEWQASPLANPDPSRSTRCVDCHMPKSGGVADHRAIGGNLYLGARLGALDVNEATRALLSTTLALSPRRAGTTVAVDVRNVGAGHSFPTGVSDIHEAWLELQAVDGAGKVLARFGGPDPDGSIPLSAARLGTDIADGDGSLLLRHELTAATRLPFDLRVPSGQSVTLSLPIPQTLPPATSELDAVLFYRNVRTSYYRLAVGDPSATPPEMELVRADRSVTNLSPKQERCGGS